jgi:glycosyltransferase involved in cell wall biosynthesis
MRRLRIFHLISNLMSGGAESMLTKLVSALGVHEHVVVSFLNGGMFEDELRGRGVRVIGLGVNRSITAALSVSRIGRLMREIEPDIVQAWMYHANLAAASAAMGRYPVIWNVRQGLQSMRHLRPLTRAVILMAVPFARSTAAIVYNSARAATDHERFFYTANKRVVIPNGFDLDRFHPDAEAITSVRQSLGLSINCKIVGHVARYDPMKDAETLFHSFAMLPTLHNSAVLVLIGRGMTAENSELGALAARYGVAERVQLLGERSDIPRLMAAFDVLVLSSRFDEGFPNVLGEAMACGVPPITTHTGECATIIADPLRVAPPGDAAALSRALGRLLAMSSAERSAIGNRDRARVLREYSLPAVAERYRLLWENVAKVNT